MVSFSIIDMVYLHSLGLAWCQPSTSCFDPSFVGDYQLCDDILFNLCPPLPQSNHLLLECRLPTPRSPIGTSDKSHLEFPIVQSVGDHHLMTISLQRSMCLGHKQILIGFKLKWGSASINIVKL